MHCRILFYKTRAMTKYLKKLFYLIILKNGIVKKKNNEKSIVGRKQSRLLAVLAGHKILFVFIILRV